MQEEIEPILLSATQNQSSEHGTIGQTPGGYPFAYILNGIKDGRASDAKGVYAIALPFAITTHILGIPKMTRALVTNFAIPSYMEPVVLEGDFPEYFSLFSDKNGQVDTRYVLDPEAMTHCIDFLSNFHWEIVHNTLYFFDDNSLPSLDVVDTFITEIEPSTSHSTRLSISFIKNKEKLLPSLSKLKCPICQTELQEGKNWLVCTKGHGYLITAKQLIETRMDSASFTKQLAQVLGRPPKFYTEIDTVEHDEIICPNCSHLMTSQPYQTTEIIIDTCRNCPYRWLDGAELNSILGSYRHE